MREMNLLPEEYLYAQKQKRKRKTWIFTVAALLILLSISYLTIYFMEYNIGKEILYVKAEINSLEKVREAQMQIYADQGIIESRQTILNKIEKESVDYYSFLDKLKKTLPAEVTLESIAHPMGIDFNLKGSTTKPDKIADFMINLAKIEGVRDVMLDTVSYDIEQENNSSFVIYFTYQLKGGESNESNQ